MKVERATAIEAIDDFGLTKAWAWETSANAGSYCAEGECVFQAGTSDGLVLILDDDLTDTTRLEYEAARAAAAPVFAMLRAGVERSEELESFVGLLRDRGVTASFSTPGELSSRITKALWEWALRTARREQIRIRQDRGRAETPTRAEAEAVKLGHGSGGELVEISVWISKARKLVEGEQTEAALQLLMDLAQGANDAGLRWLASELLGVLEELIPKAAIDKRRRGWILNIRGLALSDPDRESPEAIGAFGRMRQIGRELEDPDLESTALQNLGVAEVIAGRHEPAGELFKESVALKIKAGDTYGALEVLTNMVNVLVPDGRLDRAEGLIDLGFRLLGKSHSPELRNTLYGHRSTIARMRGDLSEARRYLRLALDAARRAKSTPREITTMQNLGSNAAQRGKATEAARWYEKALERADSLKDAPQRRIQRQALALAVSRAGDPLRAADLFETAAAEAAELGDGVNMAIATGDAGACRFEGGDPEAALELAERALAAPEGGDDEWRCGQLLNLATVLSALGRREDAFDAAKGAANLAGERWETASKALGQAAEIAMGIDSAAESLVETIDRELALRQRHQPPPEWAWRAAEFASELGSSVHRHLAPHYFSVALRSYAARGDLRQVFFIRNDRAIARVESGDEKGAAADLKVCLELAEDLSDRVLSLQALRNLGEIERRRGRLGAARALLERAVELGAELDDPSAEGEGEALLGLLEIDSGDLDRAEEIFARVTACAKDARSEELAISALKGDAHIAFLRGRKRRSATLYRRAARKLGAEPSRQLAESLSGAIVAEAALGSLAGPEIDQLEPISLQLSWDGIWVNELRGAFFAMARARGAIADLAWLGALALLISARHAESESTTGEEEDDLGPRMQELLATAMVFHAWVEEQDSGNRRGEILTAAEEIGGEAGRQAITDILGAAADLPAIDFPGIEAPDDPAEE